MKRKKVELEKKKGKLAIKKKFGGDIPGNLADENIATDHASIDELEEDITGPVKKNVPPKPDLLRGDHPDLAK